MEMFGRGGSEGELGIDFQALEGTGWQVLNWKKVGRSWSRCCWQALERG